jgi:hypothetical protein
VISLTDYLIAAFATYYLALSISREDGPFDVFLWIRNLHTDDDWIGRGLRCIVCMSCWTGLLVTVLLYLTWQFSDWALFPVVWFAVAGASTVIDRYWKR